MRLRRAHLVPLVTVPALLLAGCGDDDGDSNDTDDAGQAGSPAEPGSTEPGDGENPFEGQTPEDVINAAVRQTQQLDTFRVQLDDPTKSFSMDLRMSNDGLCSGSITDGPREQQIRSDGTDVHVRGNRAFWQSTTIGGAEMGNKVDEVLGGKWLKLSEPADISATEALCSPSTTIHSLQVPAEHFTDEGEMTTLDDGTAAVQFSSPAAGTVAVSLDEPHVILHLEAPGKGGMTFSEADEDLVVKPPKPSKVMEQPKG